MTVLTDSPAGADPFGVTMMLLDYAFSAEVRRDALGEILAHIDDTLTKDGAPVDAQARVEIIMENVASVLEMMTEQEIDPNEGVTDIAYCVIYCLGMSVGFKQVEHLRGLTGSLRHNELSLNPCLGDQEYQTEMSLLQTALHSAEGWEGVERGAPTVH